MRSLKLFFILLSIVFGIIQYIYNDFLNFDIFLILILEYSLLEKDKKGGIIIASIIGLIQDLSIGSLLGTNLFFKSLFFYILSAIKEKFFFKSILVKVIVILILFTIQNYLSFFIFKFFKLDFNLEGFKALLTYLFITPFFIFFISFLEKRYLRTNES